ncbi:MAG: leucine--tRNA ligase [Deltaproteobacteria bacterium]|nr:leucine--tRNA ligase [Deltaproteobacteria bacterium]
MEKKWQDYWEKNQTFKVGKPGPKKFYCLDMFPYPSGSGLHVGHPLGYTGSDIYSRYKRMQGYSVLHPMGFDAFGLPAEQHAVNTGEHPAVITEKNCAIFTKQLKIVGLSYDWDRNLATCTPDYYKWTQWIFLKLYNSWFDDKLQKARPIAELPIPEAVKKQGQKAIEEYQAEYRLAYYASAMVNWCPALGTVLANEEVIDGKSERGGHEVIRKPMKQWMLRITKYAERLISELSEIEWPENIKEQQRNWIGKKNGAEIKFPLDKHKESITAFTTRPDTLFGVTFFVLSPEHPLVDKITTDEAREKVEAYREEARKMSDFTRTIENRKKTGVATGGYVVNPITDELVPVFIGDYVLMNFGTGAVMGVPAHDERDFEFARTFQLDIRPVLMPEEATEEIKTAVAEGELAWTEAGTMLPNDWPVSKELGLAGKPNSEAAELITAWLANRELGKSVTTYKLRDWLFSRQRYWGEPIPIVHWDDGRVTALDESQLPLILPQVEDYKPSEGGESPLAKSGDWLTVVEPGTGRKGRRETNTMPNWAGSCWYYLRFIDPKNDKQGWSPELEKAWMSVDLYIGGAEHAVLHLLYARFWHKVLHDLNLVSTREPFKKLFNQGMIQAFAYKNRRGALVPVDEVEEQADGSAVHTKTGDKLERIVAKMSKSLRNVVNLDDIVHQYGADTLRMYLMFAGPLDTGRVWDPKAITGNYRFLKKAWAFVTDNRDSGIRDVVEDGKDSLVALKAIHRVVKKVTHDIEGLEFNTAISAMMEFLNTAGGEQVSKSTLEKFVLILSPFAPHIGEELWQRLGHSKTLAYEPWPTFDEKLLEEETVVVVIQVNGKKRALVEVAADISQEALNQAVIEKMAGTDYKVSSANRFITVFRSGTAIPKLVNVMV